MKYFTTINSLSELKKKFRALVLINHPDRGGSTEAMQALNAEFGQLYKIWEHKQPTAATTESTGYESDYEGATAKEYTEHVYNEYRWKGSRYDRNLRNSDLLKLFRTWLKETYPGCRFTMNQQGYNSINLHVMKMDFNPFRDGVMRKRYTPNRYRISEDAVLNDRARDVMANISSYIQSYNYDDSDIMTDYHDTNFYFDIEFGNDNTAFAVELPRDRRTGGVSQPEFKRPIGRVHQAIKTALGKAYFSHCEFRRGESFAALGEDHIYDEETEFYPLTYSGKKTAQKRVDKLQSVGVQCDIVGCYIRFLGYTPETERSLADEERAADAAEKEWNERKEASTTDAPKESAGGSESKPATEPGTIEITHATPATIHQALRENNLLNTSRLMQIQQSGYESLFIDYIARYFRDMSYSAFALDGLISSFPLEELTTGSICIYMQPSEAGRSIQLITGSNLGICLARIMQQYEQSREFGETWVNSLSFPLSDQVYVIDVPLLSLLIDRGAISIDEYLQRTRQTA